jgi:putative ABC transport system substrate-binding protein
MVLLGSGCGLLPAQLQSSRVARLGFLALARVPPARLEALRTGLRERGWVEDQNLVLIERYADGRADRLPDLAAELLRLGAEVITGPASPPIQAARQVSATTPIVMITTSDPVADGLANSLARPGGTVTGLTLLAPQMSAKRLELLREVAPSVSRLAVLWNPTNPSQEGILREVQITAEAIGLQARAFDVGAADQLDGALAAARSWPADSLAVLQDVLLLELRARVAVWAAQARLPAVYGARENVEAGGLLSYGPSQVALYGRAAEYVDKILRGANPADLPIEQPTTFDFVVNLKTAQALGLTIPPDVRAQVTEWIE